MHEANPSPAAAAEKSGEMDCQELSWTSAGGRLWEPRPGREPVDSGLVRGSRRDGTQAAGWRGSRATGEGGGSGAKTVSSQMPGRIRQGQTPEGEKEEKLPEKEEPDTDLTWGRDTGTRWM